MLTSNGSTNSVLILALILLPVVLASPTSTHQRLHRRDPLRRFKYYDGDYDLRSKHYWASLAFTGVHGYAIAGVWMICGLGCCMLWIIKNNAVNSTSSGILRHSDSWNYLVFVLIVVFTMLAITATGFVLATNRQSLHESRRMKGAVVGAGSDARREIHRVSKAMKDIQVYLCPYDSNTCALLNATAYRLGNESLAIKEFVEKNGHLIDRAISFVYITNLVVVVLNLVLMVAALALIFLHWNLEFVIVIFFCWIFLTTACWVLAGIDFVLHTFAEDTCTALHSFLMNPTNSSLSSLLPCEKLLRSEHIITEIGQTVHNFITAMNTKMIELQKEFGLSELTEHNDRQASTQICDPFSGPPNYTYVQDKCPKNTIPIGQLSGVLERLTCNNNGSSLAGRCLPESYYAIAYAFIRSIQDLVGVYPDLDSLIYCSFVKRRISEAELQQCRPFRSSTRELWVSMLCLSSAMVVLVLLWAARAWQDVGRSLFLGSNHAQLQIEL